MRKPLIVANLKMDKGVGGSRMYARQLRRAVAGPSGGDVVVCSSFGTLFAVAEELAGSPIAWGAQNVHWVRQGPFTGEVSPDHPENMPSFMGYPDIDGALVGGASLDPKSFVAIVRFELNCRTHPR
jgi:triosephosphate isomerase